MFFLIDHHTVCISPVDTVIDDIDNQIRETQFDQNESSFAKTTNENFTETNQHDDTQTKTGKYAKAKSLSTGSKMLFFFDN